MSGFLWAAVGRWELRGSEDWDYEIYTTHEDALETVAEWSGLEPAWLSVWQVPASLVPCDLMDGATGAADPDYEWSLWDVDRSQLVESDTRPAWKTGRFGS